MSPKWPNEAIKTGGRGGRSTVTLGRKKYETRKSLLFWHNPGKNRVCRMEEEEAPEAEELGGTYLGVGRQFLLLSPQKAKLFLPAIPRKSALYLPTFSYCPPAVTREEGFFASSKGESLRLWLFFLAAGTV